MFIKSSAILIYEAQDVASNGSPIRVTIQKEVMVDEMKQFSSNYYNEQQRNMRCSRNLIVPVYLTDDIIQDSKRYELMYAMYDGLKYKVKNILSLRGTRQRMILDIQEVR